MPEYEVSKATGPDLGRMGRAGWQLVTVSDGNAYWQREVRSAGGLALAGHQAGCAHEGMPRLADHECTDTRPAEMIMSSGELTCPDIQLDPAENAEACHCGGKVRYGRCRDCDCKMSDETCDELAQRWAEAHYR